MDLLPSWRPGRWLSLIEWRGAAKRLPPCHSRVTRRVGMAGVDTADATFRLFETRCSFQCERLAALDWIGRLELAGNRLGLLDRCGFRLGHIFGSR